MEKRENAPRSFILSIRLYQALLNVYPSEFRKAYGQSMLQVFRDCTLQALRESGDAGLPPLWYRTMLDTVKTAIEEHSQRGVFMSKERFIKLSSWALMLGGLLIVLGGLGSSRPQYDQYNAYSLLVDRYANAAGTPLMVIGMLLVSMGFAGLIVRYGQRMGSFGRYSLGLGALSGVIGAVGAVGMSTNNDGGSWWAVFILGIAFQFLGLTLFGIATLRQRSMPRWNGLPVLAGMWIPLYLFGSMGIDLVNSAWPESPAIDLLVISLTLIGLLVLGYQLQSESQPADTIAGTV